MLHSYTGHPARGDEHKRVVHPSYRGGVALPSPHNTAVKVANDGCCRAIGLRDQVLTGTPRSFSVRSEVQQVSCPTGQKSDSLTGISA